eukprot:951368-Amphidinium_carterae.1
MLQTISEIFVSKSWTCGSASKRHPMAPFARAYSNINAGFGNRCIRRHTFIVRCGDGAPRPQLVGWATSTTVVRRQREKTKMRSRQRLRSLT